MSRRNVEIVSRMYDAYARGDEETSLSFFDPAVEFSQPPMQPGAATFHGHEGVLRAMAEWTEPWEDYRVEVEELTDLGEQVLATTRHRARGKGSGVAVDQLLFQLLALRDGRIVRMRMYHDRSEALRAAESPGPLS